MRRMVSAAGPSVARRRPAVSRTAAKGDRQSGPAVGLHPAIRLSATAGAAISCVLMARTVRAWLRRIHYAGGNDPRASAVQQLDPEGVVRPVVDVLHRARALWIHRERAHLPLAGAGGVRLERQRPSGEVANSGRAVDIMTPGCRCVCSGSRTPASMITSSTRRSVSRQNPVRCRGGDRAVELLRPWLGAAHHEGSPCPLGGRCVSSRTVKTAMAPKPFINRRVLARPGSLVGPA
jgi:hypothetical protein